MDTSGDGAYTSGGQVTAHGFTRPECDGNTFNVPVICVGTGTTAVTINDYTLDEQILDGSNSGQLDRQGTATVSARFSNSRSGKERH